ncbi:sulfatase [Candidatus Hydrogenedentota bacterium]
MTTRREFLSIMTSSIACATMTSSIACATTGANASESAERNKPLNILLFTADDLHCESVGCFNGKPEGLTPNLDKFAEEGMRFFRAHVNVAICAPSRSVLGTGIYSHNSGAMGFMHANPGTPNVIGIFQKAGYLAGVLGKVQHSTPCKDDKWDYSYDQKDLGNGRNPDIYAQRCKVFFDKCKADKKPFYFMVNSHDPHRPYHIPGKHKGKVAEPSKLYSPEDAPDLGFVPDIPGVRKELAYYLNSTRRCDDTFGKVMEALEESGFANNTLVMFLSDNGIAVPFAKCNCYLASTLTPWIVRWPGVTKPGCADKEHFISGVDYLPTVLEATGVSGPEKLDGKSFMPLLKGESQQGRGMVFTQIDSKAGGDSVPMRCVQNERFGYIFNAWSDGEFWYRNNNEGMSMKAMEEAAKTDPTIAARVEMFRYRVLEEFYDLKSDPACLKNLIEDPASQKERAVLIEELRAWMKRTGDPVLPAFENRYDAKARKNALTAVLV